MDKIRRLKRRKGFTLVELIVVTAIIALLMACVAAFSSPVQQMMSETVAEADALKIANISGDYIERRIAYAEGLVIYTGVNFDATNKELSDMYTTYYDYYAAKGNVNAGMLVFRYEPSADVNEPYKATYRMYDIPIKTGDTYPKSLNNLSQYDVFSDAFYSDYQYLYLVDTEILMNNVKYKAYVNFDVYAYDFTSDYGKMITVDGTDKAGNKVNGTLNQYYLNKKDPVTNTSDGLTDLVRERKAHENVSFALENVEIETVNDPANGKVVGTPLYVSYPTISTPANKGNDIVIFYNVETYSTTTIG